MSKLPNPSTTICSRTKRLFDSSPEKITVLHLRDSPWLCGPGRTILESAVHIDPERFTYLIGAFCKFSEGSNEFIDAARGRNVNVFPIYEDSPFDFNVISQIMAIVKAHRVDFVHSHEFRSDIFAFLIHVLYGVPVLATSQGWIQNDPKGRVMTWIDKLLLRFFNHVIVVSDKMRAELLRWGIREHRLSVIQNALVTSNFQKDVDDRSFRTLHGIDDQTLLIAKIGRLSPEKRQIDVIAAAEAVVRSIPSVKFLIIGKGPDEDFLKREVHRRNLTPYFVFTGYIEDMHAVFNAIDLVVQTSTTEGMPNVILEALAYEIPAIATDVGGTGEIITDGLSGILVPPKRPDLIADHIVQFHRHPSPYRQMGATGRKRVTTAFGFDRRTDKLMDLYGTLSQRRRIRR